MAAFAVAVVHDGHAAVTVNGALVAVIACYDALGVNGTTTGSMTAAVGVAGAAVLGRTGFCGRGEGEKPNDDGKCSDDDFHILCICVVRPVGRTGYETYSVKHHFLFRAAAQQDLAITLVFHGTFERRGDFCQCIGGVDRLCQLALADPLSKLLIGVADQLGIGLLDPFRDPKAMQLNAFEDEEFVGNLKASPTHGAIGNVDALGGDDVHQP